MGLHLGSSAELVRPQVLLGQYNVVGHISEVARQGGRGPPHPAGADHTPEEPLPYAQSNDRPRRGQRCSWRVGPPAVSARVRPASPGRGAGRLVFEAGIGTGYLWLLAWSCLQIYSKTIGSSHQNRPNHSSCRTPSSPIRSYREGSSFNTDSESSKEIPERLDVCRCSSSLLIRYVSTVNLTAPAQAGECKLEDSLPPREVSTTPFSFSSHQSGH